MECNRDEASRAKSIAEGKFEQKDFLGAHKFAVKAQVLYPGLDGISQMLKTLEVYVTAENKIGGEIDWYGVLHVKPSDDDATIKKQYRKLALMLHPDKNKSVGAEGAFKIISEAWKLLSDKEKRLAYNQRSGYKRFQQNVQTHSAVPSAPSRPSQQKVATHSGSRSAASKPNQQKVPKHSGGPSTPFRASQQEVPRHTGGPSAPLRPSQEKVPKHTGSTPSTPSRFSNCANKRTSAPKSQTRSAKGRKPTTAPSHQRTDTFWTTCCQCRAIYEYLKIYYNCTISCINCQKPFLASEIAPPVNYLKSSNLWRPRNSDNNLAGRNACDPGRNVAAAQKSGVGQDGPSSFSVGNYQGGPIPGTADNGSSTEPSIAEKAHGVVQEGQDNLKRPHIETNDAAVWEGCFKKKKLGSDSSGYGMNCSGTGHSGFGTASPAGFRSYGFSDTYDQPNSTRDLTPLETQKLLVVKAQKEIVEKLSESTRGTTVVAADEDKCTIKVTDEGKYGLNSNIQGLVGNQKNQLLTRVADQSERQWADPSDDNVRKDILKAVSIDVADSDFHDFDVDRSKNSFSDNEIWAAYDNDDGMPRLYALISKVVSRDPFELRITWLDSKTNREFSDIDWVGSGFYKTCGKFELGECKTCISVNAFSQRVNWSKTPNGNIIILPRKGDIWALYRNWSLDWSESTPDEVVHKYDMVMVLDDYSEKEGVSVAPLEKVAGFRTVFLPILDSAVIQRIPKEEIFRFSHRVPDHFLSREEAPTAPRGSIELDPAAMPLELLQLITKTGGV